MSPISYLLNLIGRLQDSEDAQIRENAYREVFSLNDPDFVQHLQDFMSYERLSSFRKQTYFCLAYLALNLQRADIIHYLLSQVKEETERNLITSVFGWISDVGMKAGLHLTQHQEFVESLAKDKKGKIRQHALCILELYAPQPVKVQPLTKQGNSKPPRNTTRNIKRKAA